MKICPDLTTIRWEQSILRGRGDYQAITLNECISEKCAAYKEGNCMKYNTRVKER